MPERRTYADRKRAGEQVDILDEVEAWHESNRSMPLHEWLGLTWEEYAAWVEQRENGPDTARDR